MRSKRTPEIEPEELANRKLRFAIAYATQVYGRNKTSLLLKAWHDQLKDDHSPESTVVDAMNRESEDE